MDISWMPILKRNPYQPIHQSSRIVRAAARKRVHDSGCARASHPLRVPATSARMLADSL